MALVLGDGARESALKHYLQSEERMMVDLNQTTQGLAVVGSDDLLANGIVDEHLKKERTPIFGPTKNLARLETSKAYSYELCQFLDIPVPKTEICHGEESAILASCRYSIQFGHPPVLKKDGLARGKGVCLPHSIKECSPFITSHFQTTPEMPLLVSHRMTGPELSLHALCDGRDYVLLPPAMDYKRALDGDKGEMTGGMGCIASQSLINQTAWEALGRQFVQPIIKHFAKKDQRGFRGCLYVGLIKDASGWMALEYNVRFGDPEAQALLPLIRKRFLLYDLLSACANGSLRELVGKRRLKKVLPYEGHCVVITIADRDYPKPYTGKPIFLCREAHPDQAFILKGTYGMGRIGSIGGYAGGSVEDARNVAYNYLHRNLKEMIASGRIEDIRYRTDIGKNIPAF